MKCPHCSKKVSIFSSEMNKNSATRKCPHCGEGVRFGVNIPVAIAVAVVLIFAWTFASNFLDARLGIVISITAIAMSSTVLRKEHS